MGRNSVILRRHLGISDATVARAWRAYRVAPWRRDTFKFSTGPALEAKVREHLCREISGATLKR
jgi:hypothetical protein